MRASDTPRRGTHTADPRLASPTYLLHDALRRRLGLPLGVPALVDLVVARCTRGGSEVLAHAAQLLHDTCGGVHLALGAEQARDVGLEVCEAVAGRGGVMRRGGVDVLTGQLQRRLAALDAGCMVASHTRSTHRACL